MKYSTVQYNAVQYSTVQYSTVYIYTQTVHRIQRTYITVTREKENNKDKRK
jgi:hypothetical protein